MRISTLDGHCHQVGGTGTDVEYGYPVGTENPNISSSEEKLTMVLLPNWTRGLHSAENE